MPRAIWTGAISFGLVNVPVKLYSAVQRKTRALQPARLRGQRPHPAEAGQPGDGRGGPVRAARQGLRDRARTRTSIVEPDELEALEPRRTKTIDILDFVDLADIDPIFYDHPYYLAPGAGGSKPYKLLLDAMRETGKVAIAQRRHPPEAGARRRAPAGDVLQMARSSTPTRSSRRTASTTCPTRASRSTERELAIAKQLVESLAADWEPEQYKDEYREKVMQLIESKAAGEEVAVQPEAEEAAPVPDLMAALKASLDAVAGRRRAAKKAREEEAGTRRQAQDAAPRAGKHPAGMPPAIRLRRSDTTEPGIRAAPPRPRLRVPRPRRDEGRRPRGAPAHQRARHPAGVEGRLDLPVPRRPHPGDRHRRPRAQAVPLPPEVAPAARPGEVRRHAALRPRAAGAARGSSTSELGGERDVARAGAGLRRAAARHRLLPHRLGGLRGRERDLRPGDDAQGARDAARRRHAAVRLPGQERQAARCSRSSTPTSPRSCAALKRRRGGKPELLAYKRGRRWVDVRSPDINEYLKDRTGLDVSRQGLPHLERDAARRGRARRVGPRARVEDRAQARGRRARSRRSRTTSATRRRSRARPTSTRASSTASPTA